MTLLWHLRVVLVIDTRGNCVDQKYRRTENLGLVYGLAVAEIPNSAPQPFVGVAVDNTAGPFELGVDSPSKAFEELAEVHTAPVANI